MRITKSITLRQLRKYNSSLWPAKIAEHLYGEIEKIGSKGILNIRSVNTPSDRIQYYIERKYHICG